MGGVTTVYIGDYFEWTGSTGTMKKYYYAGGQRVAMRVGASTRYFLLSDHLGSTALVTNSSGARVAEVRYKAWGEDRYTYGTTPTTYRYTGQRWEVGPGLYFYRARWYDPGLGRFIQADTIVPEPGNPQSLNRLSYVLNNPLRFCDPTGHCTGNKDDPNDPDHECWEKWKMINDPGGKYYGIVELYQWFGGNWTNEELGLILKALDMILQAFGNDLQRMKQAIAPRVPLGLTKYAVDPFSLGAVARYTPFGLNHNIIFSNYSFEQMNDYGGAKVLWYIVHEIGHAVDWAGDSFFSPPDSLSSYYAVGRGEWNLFTGYDPGTDKIVGSPGSYASINPFEDFAQTFACTVFYESGYWQWGGPLTEFQRTYQAEVSPPGKRRMAYMLNFLRGNH